MVDCAVAIPEVAPAVVFPAAPALVADTALACAGSACLLLLLGAAHDLTIWIGQCVFAIAAVLVWINTPDVPPAVD